VEIPCDFCLFLQFFLGRTVLAGRVKFLKFATQRQVEHQTFKSELLVLELDVLLQFNVMCAVLSILVVYRVRFSEK
jgi:hypothetical protein